MADGLYTGKGVIRADTTDYEIRVTVSPDGVSRREYWMIVHTPRGDDAIRIRPYIIRRAGGGAPTRATLVIYAGTVEVARTETTI